MKRLLLRLIRFYRRRISPARPPACRFIPTCSEYAYLAVERFGPAKGSLLAAKRLAKMCIRDSLYGILLIFPMSCHLAHSPYVMSSCSCSL